MTQPQDPDTTSAVPEDTPPPSSAEEAASAAAGGDAVAPDGHDLDATPAEPPADDPLAAADDPLAAADDPLAVAQRERDEYLDALRRKQAEFENFRKRMMRDGASQRIAGHAEVAERMLDVLDDFDRTLEAAGVDAQSPAPGVEPGFLKGVQLVHDKLARVLADFGLTRIDDTEVVFDPNRHEAVQQVAADTERDEPVVSQVLRPGYELGGRTLRAAMVVVEQ